VRLEGVGGATVTVYGSASNPGAPGTWQREVFFALHAARVGEPYGRNKYRMPAPFTSRGIRVIEARFDLPYGRSTGRNAFLTHMPRALFLAWRRGQLAGHMVAWWCGSRTAYFQLLDEPTSPTCPACVAYQQRGAGRS
jgi:hypothetical protein